MKVPTLQTATRLTGIERPRLGRGVRILSWALAIGVVVLALATVMDRFYSSKYSMLLSRSKAESEHQPEPQDASLNVTQISPPLAVSIFGERVPLENYEIRERFEREFYYNYTNSDQLLLIWKRAQRWFPHIEKALEQAGLPTDFKYLMVAESGLKNVKSPANALGFWQFIPGTGMKYGLRVDDLIDDRLDPERSTQAAIAFFQKMHAEFPSWTLVAAGFNMGDDGLRLALGFQHQTSYWNLYLNDETMRYVLRIAAIKELIEHGERYGLFFKKTAPFRDPQYRTIAVQGPVASIADWALAQGYSYKDVREFNPWMAGRALPSGNFTIRVPATDLDRTTVQNP